MSKPITTPFTFQTQAGPIPLSELDTDFLTAANAINDFATYSNYLADTSGAANQITVTIPVGTTFSYSAGVALQVLLANTNTSTAVQINVSGIGNKAVQNIDGSVPAVGQLVVGMILQLQYNGTVFLLTGAASKPGSIAPFTATPTGDVTLPASTGGSQTLLVNGTANQDTIHVAGSSTVGQSFGYFANAGTTSADYGLRINSQGGTTLFIVRGDGGVVIASPSGGDMGLGTINATGLFVNGVSIGGGSSLNKFKPASTSRSSNATPTIDPDLQVTLVSGKTYQFRLVTFLSAAGAGGFLAQLGGSATWTTATAGGYARQNGAAAIVTLIFGVFTNPNTLTAGGGAAAVNDSIDISGTVTVNAGGTFGILWSQFSSNVAATAVGIGSYLTVTPMN
jgi:hypothetical protein